jgi:hypothetical protein
VTSYEEWRVTGTLRSGKTYETFYPDEASARALITRAREVGSFTDGPYLHKGVTVTDWKEVEP